MDETESPGPNRGHRERSNQAMVSGRNTHEHFARRSRILDMKRLAAQQVPP